MRQDELAWLRYTFELAERAVSEGDQPFAAALVGPDGGLLVEAMNTRGRTGDATGHAETLVCREASTRWPREQLMLCTLYSSTEPCVMCTGAIAWLGVGRLVFGLSQGQNYALFPTLPPTRFRTPISCRVLLANVQPPIEVIGPLLEDEAERPHRVWFSGQELASTSEAPPAPVEPHSE